MAETKEKSRAPWTWGTLSAPSDASVNTEVLILRYLANPQSGGHSREALRAMSGAKSVEDINQMLYGRQKKLAKLYVPKIAEALGTTVEELALCAKRWAENGESPPEFHDVIPLKGCDQNRNYVFRRNWLKSKGITPNKAFVIKVPDQFLSEFDILEGDLLLIDSTDTSFWPGAFYAVEYAGMQRIYRAFVKQQDNYLCVDRQGMIIPHILFAEANVLGRAVWRGTDLRA